MVEDDENDALFFERAVKKNGFPYRIQVARNGQEAIDYISGKGEYGDRTRFPYPSFIVTDNRMPIVTGSQFLKWLRDHPDYHVVPTIVLGGSDSPAEIDRAYESLGVHSYMLKPADPEKLSVLVKLIFEYWSVCRLPSAKPETQLRRAEFVPA